jgi:hypothetical protein
MVGSPKVSDSRAERLTRGRIDRHIGALRASTQLGIETLRPVIIGEAAANQDVALVDLTQRERVIESTELGP